MSHRGDLTARMVQERVWYGEVNRRKRTLTPPIGVRIPASQPFKLKDFGLAFGLHFVLLCAH